MRSDIMSLFSSEFLHAWDLFDASGKALDYSLTILEVKGTELTTEGGALKRAPVVTFKGAKKRLVLNKTNARTIAAIHGRDFSKWIGKVVTLYPAKTQFGKSRDVPCIRIRPTTATESAPPGSLLNREPSEADYAMAMAQQKAVQST